MRFSIIVVFYNMQREARRTLLTLSRAYQQRSDNIDYEVLCIDNGSQPPMEASFIESFGPEFRLIRPDPVLSSPCKAINDAVRQARGEHLCIMIDGAHLLSPGVFALADEILSAHPQAMVGLRQWFVAGDQRWLSQIGYTREKEDEVFARNKWPDDPYSIFTFSRPMHEVSNTWFQGMPETNCLFVPTSLYKEIGGFDERFDEPGAGYANLDLFTRAAAKVHGPIVSMIGEASFHQFHGGTTTNRPDQEKNKLIAGYSAKFRQLKNAGFQGVGAHRMAFYGRIAGIAPISSEARPNFTFVNTNTSQLRRGQTQKYFGKGRRAFLLSNYAEDDIAHTTWLGEPVSVYPADLIAIQEIIQRTRPQRVVLPNAEPGLVRYVDSMLKLTDTVARIVWPAATAKPLQKIAAPLTIISVEPGEDAAIAETQAQCANYERILVLYSPGDAAKLTIQAMLPYARLVSPLSYFVLLGTVRGRPWIGYSNFDGAGLVRNLIHHEPDFLVDYSWENRHIMIASPDGYLLRQVGKFAGLDETLDTYFAEHIS